MNRSPFKPATSLPMQASRWLQLQALVDAKEMEDLLNQLEGITIYRVGQVLLKGEECITKEEFCARYSHYVEHLKSNQIPDAMTFRAFFSSVFTHSCTSLIFLPVGQDRQIVRVAKPVVQLQLHMMGYSEIENKLRPMVFGKDNIHWGLQVSYPQLFLNPENNNVEKALNEEQFKDAQLFKKMQLWIRHNTLPVPFIIRGERMNVPMRLGKHCFPWINRHPQLKARGIEVTRKFKGVQD